VDEQRQQEDHERYLEAQRAQERSEQAYMEEQLHYAQREQEMV
jgi:hypothetical protein